MTHPSDDPHNLQRFVEAQRNVYAQAHAELLEGRKRTHWMWFIFPQIKGLGHSAMARHYAITSREEAEAYLHHPVLGARLRECTTLVNRVENQPIEAILGSPDDLKFHSCVTLFAHATADNKVFLEALARYFNGVPDEATLSRL